MKRQRKDGHRNWIEVNYGGKHLNTEAFACTGCGAVSEQSWSGSPEQGKCTCSSCRTLVIPSDKFKENYLQIFGHE